MSDEGSDVVTGLAGVRKRPGMYFGSTSARGVEALVGEFASNAIDQFVGGHATGLRVTLEGQRIRVEDDGTGLPFDVEDPETGLSLATRFLTELHFTASALGHAPHVHIHKLRGVGLAAVNAVALEATYRSWRDGKLWEQTLRRGLPDSPPRVIDEGQGRGTVVDLLADPDIWGDAIPRSSMVRSTLWHAAHLFPGLRVSLGDETFVAPGGLGDLAYTMFPDGSSLGWDWDDRTPFEVQGRADDVEVVVALMGTARATRWRSWVNGMETTEQGTERRGLRRCLKRVGWTPAAALIHVMMHSPEYGSPTRDKLVAPQVPGAVERIVLESLEAFCTANAIGRWSS